MISLERYRGNFKRDKLLSHNIHCRGWIGAFVDTYIDIAIFIDIVIDIESSLGVTI